MPEVDHPATETKASVSRLPGITGRGKREREWVILEKQRLFEEDQSRSDRELQELAEAELAKMMGKSYGPQYLRAFEATSPVSTTPKEGVDPELEIAAFRHLGEVRGLCDHLAEPPARPGPRPDRSAAIALLMNAAMGSDDPKLRRCYRNFSRSSPLHAWAYGYPDASLQKSAMYESVHDVLRDRDPGMVVKTNLRLVKRLAEHFNSGQAWPRPRAGRKKNDGYLVGEIGLIDGTQVKAHTPQRSGLPKGKRFSREHERVLRGKGRSGVDSARYVNERGETTMRNTGYRLTVISDLATTLPLAWTVGPATENERAVVDGLLEAIFAEWPECPMHALVGDSLFDHSNDLPQSLVFNWGIQPVFESHGAGKSESGVPRCNCGLMQMHSCDIPTAVKRAREGIRRGERYEPDVVRIRWRCPNKLCGQVTTDPREDPRRSTWYPKEGESDRAIERRVLLHRRNSVESIFFSLQARNVGGKDSNPPAWANDNEVDWLMSLALMGMTARRLVHHLGTYDAVERVAKEIGFLTPPSPENPCPGPDSATLDRADALLTDHLEDPVPIDASRAQDESRADP